MPKITSLASVALAIGHCCRLRGGVLLLAFAWLAFGSAQAQTTNCTLGTASLAVGPAAGTNSVVLGVTPATGAWTAAASTNWLQLSLANQSGTGPTNVIFTYEANPGPTRSGTLAIGGQTLTVTQAGSTYVAAQPITILVGSGVTTTSGSSPSTGLNRPSGLAVDGAGNVYFADTGNSAIKEWSANNNSVTTLVSEFFQPTGVAVDDAGDVYFSGANAVWKWTAASNTLSTIVTSVRNGVAVDGAGDVYVTGLTSILEWTPVSNSATTLVTNLGAAAVAVDGAGNVYLAESDGDGLGEIMEWTVANSNVITLVSSGLYNALGVAVDGSGNVYIADTQNNAIKEWNAANGNVTTLVPSNYALNLPAVLGLPAGAAVDGAGNVYFADTANNMIMELSFAFVDPTVRSESNAGGNDALPPVLPVTEHLFAPFAPTSSQPWLTITGVTNGVVSFSFTPNTGPNRGAYIIMLGQTIPVTQGGTAYILGAAARQEGPGAGSDSVVLGVIPPLAAWTATANASWLHLTAPNQAGAGGTNVVFSYDANPGATRSGTLTIGDQTLTVTQAGSNYVAAGPLTVLATGFSLPEGIAVDGAGNVYIADANAAAVKKWTAANNTVTTLATDVSDCNGVAVDAAGNVYILGGRTESVSGAVLEWSAATSNLTALVPAELSYPNGVAVDGTGHVYIADTYHLAIKEFTPANNTFTTLMASLPGYPEGVAVDAAGNVYTAVNNSIAMWVAANNTVTTLVSGLTNAPDGVAVDGAGNVYMLDNYYDNSVAISQIQVWSAASNTVTTLVSSGLAEPEGLAVDATGNVYIADVSLLEQPYAFVDPTPRLESGGAASDALVVLPSTVNLLPPFAPSSDQPWLTITGTTNGVVSFSVSANPGLARTAHISVLGQTVPITQVILGPPQILSALPPAGNGVFQFAFGNTQNASFTVLSATNLLLPLRDWTVLGTASNPAPNVFEFTDPQATNSQRFYRVISP